MVSCCVWERGPLNMLQVRHCTGPITISALKRKKNGNETDLNRVGHVVLIVEPLLVGELRNVG